MIKKTSRISSHIGEFIQSHSFLPINRRRNTQSTAHEFVCSEFQVEDNFSSTNYLKSDITQTTDNINLMYRNQTHQTDQDWSNEATFSYHRSMHIDKYESDNNHASSQTKLNMFDERKRKRRRSETLCTTLLDHPLNIDQRLHSSLSQSRIKDYYSDLGARYSSRKYPRSLEDLTDLEMERILERDTTFHLPIRALRSQESVLARYRRRYEESIEDRDENYLRLYQSLSRLDKMMPREKYPPGKVHYEREYKIYGRDTVALIYYKTCYL